jgi:hypothetical protein
VDKSIIRGECNPRIPEPDWGKLGLIALIFFIIGLILKNIFL